MNLYVATPTWELGASFWLAETDEEAMQHGVYVAAQSAVNGCGSPSADVYLIAKDIKHIGEALATDAPREWKWAYPGVEENAASVEELYASLGKPIATG
jgi:hypothetical protein